MIVSFVCPSARQPMGGVTAQYEFANGLRRLGHDVHIAHGAFWGRPGIRSLDEVPWFRFEPGIHHHFGDGEIPLPPADVIFGTGAPPELGLPVVLVQGLDMFPPAMEQAVFRTPCLKVCVASWLVEAGRRHGCPAEQLVHVPMGIDHDRFRPSRPAGSRDVHVAMLYNDHQAKGWVPGMRALELVKALVPDLRAVVFGTKRPPERLPDWITFELDPSPEALVQDVYGRCQVFLQPSYYEGFGFTALEAMACGAALVTTDNGGSRDYATDGVTALVVPPGDPGAMALGIEALLLDPDRRESIARAGEQRSRGFDWATAAQQLERHLVAYVADPDAYRRPPRPLPVPAADR
ncbi:MAG: glycosyltransferase family 4 protein [Acidimicrobiia bacterium]